LNSTRKNQTVVVADLVEEERNTVERIRDSPMPLKSLIFEGSLCP